MVEALLDGAAIAQVPEHMVERHFREALFDLLPEFLPRAARGQRRDAGARMMLPRLGVLIDAPVSAFNP